jgi:hypothetical protein
MRKDGRPPGSIVPFEGQSILDVRERLSTSCMKGLIGLRKKVRIIPCEQLEGGRCGGGRCGGNGGGSG